jgi:uncharacterized protein (DUF58 family)
MPTREVYALAVLTLLIFFVAFNLQSGWVYAVDALLVGLLIAGFLSAQHAVRKISIRRSLPAEAVEGASIGVALVLGATGFGRRFFVEVLDAVPGLQPAEVFVPAVDPRQGARARYMTTALRRGVHRAATARVRSGGLAGIFAASREVSAPGEITIYPRYWKISRFPLGGWTSAPQSAGLTRRQGGLEFHGLRDYRPGDSLRHVHWRSSARRGSLMVREFEQEIPGSVTLVIDTRPDVQRGGEVENTFETLLRAAASVTWYITSRGGAVRLLAATPADPLDLTGGWRPILQALAGLRAEGRLPPAALLRFVAISGTPSAIVLTPDPRALAAPGLHIAGIFADPTSYDDHVATGSSALLGVPGRPVCVIRKGDDIGACLEGSDA